MIVLNKALNSKQSAEFRKQVKVEMILQNISYEELARKTGYSLTTIRHNIADSNPTVSKFVASAIADYLKIDISAYESK